CARTSDYGNTIRGSCNSW
nr:immunoglobulin heavy chain junction region [Macaca mulatta]